MSRAIFIKTSQVLNPHSPYNILVDADQTRFGRRGDVKLDTISGHEVSRVHSILYRRDANDIFIWIIEDNKSLNGTFVNGKKIYRTVLHHGDEVVFGGGSTFQVGDKVHTTDNAECRYKFYILAPKVQFDKSINLKGIIDPENPNNVCSICYSSMIASESLPCGHSFCLSCIHEWSRVCTKSLRPCICPLCRTPFNKSQLTPDEGVLTAKKLLISSVEPILRELDYEKIDEIKRLTIFKEWDMLVKEKFWSCYNMVKYKEIRKLLFLHLVGATFERVSKQPVKKLQIALENLDGEPGSEHDQLVNHLLRRIFHLFYPQKYLPAYYNSSKYM